MTYIKNKIQDGYLLRKGWRGRFLTVYSHTYGKNPEKTGRSHKHPWWLAISVVWRGSLHDIIVGEDWNIDDRSVTPWEEHRERAGRWFWPSITFYTRTTEHRVGIHTEPGTQSVFIGLFRIQDPAPNATVCTSEGFAHYTELTALEYDHYQRNKI